MKFNLTFIIIIIIIIYIYCYFIFPKSIQILQTTISDFTFTSLHTRQPIVVSDYLQEKEVQILEIIYDYCVLKEYIINNETVLCADGLILYKKYTNKTTIEKIISKM